MMTMKVYGVIRRKPPSPLLFQQSQAIHGPARPNNHTPVAQYPPIPGHKNKKETDDAKAKSFMNKLKTVEEKQYQINRPKYYGWYSYKLYQDWIPADGKDFLQFATQTRVIDGLPSCYHSQEDDNVDKLVDQIAPLVEQLVINDQLYSERGSEVSNDLIPLQDNNAVYWGGGREYKLEQFRSEQLITKVHQMVSTLLAGKEGGQHLQAVSEDFRTRNEAFWFRGGINPDKSMLKKREGTKKTQQRARDKGYKISGNDGRPSVISDTEVTAPYERALQFQGMNTVQVRCKDPLAPFVSRSDPLATEPGQVPIVPHDPRTWGYRATTQHGTNVPGYWPQDDNQHGLLLFSHRTNRYNSEAMASSGVINDQVVKDQMTGRAILNCFGWLLPQAVHLGFGPMTELTFPLATQAVLSDGKTWTYYAYQLNTTDLTPNDPTVHSHNNILWAGEDLQLYSRIEDRKLVDFNPSVLAPLVRMYLRKGEKRTYSITPYLGEESRVTDFQDDYQRKFLFDKIRDVYSKRPPKVEKPEMYLWEKMHLVDHPGHLALSLGLRRRRWFQMAKVSHLGREHWHPEFKTLDEQQNRYIPKWYREPWQRKKGLGRRYSKHAPKLKIPLQDEPLSVHELPKSTRYVKPEE